MTTTATSRSQKPDDPDALEQIAERLRNGDPVNRRLNRGRLKIDRPHPFLCLHRRPASGAITGTERLVTGEASYLVAPGDSDRFDDVARLVDTIAAIQSEEFGAFLLLELWAGEHSPEESDEPIPPAPEFTIVTPKGEWPDRTVERLSRSLRALRLDRRDPIVRLEERGKVQPPGIRQLIGKKRRGELEVSVIGLEVAPIWHNPANGEIYPRRLLALRRRLGRTLRQTFYEFVRSRTDRRPVHFHVLGPKAVTKAVWQVDERLATISTSFDLLLGVTPVNQESSWRQFRRAKYQKPPHFLYRPLEIDPELLKRGLFNIPIERVEDPALAGLLREKQEELDRQITLLRDRNTERFLYEGLQLYGRPKSEEVETARAVLEIVTDRREEEPSRGRISATEFAAMAEREFAWFREEYPTFSSTVQIRDDINRGLMVSHGNLLIGKGTSIPKRRAEALIQHEVGTHVLTYTNGRAQPLQQLYCGLAGYDPFQEGTAVLAEYLVGGLTPARLRLLAARVLGVDAMLAGADFVETFRMIRDDHGFTPRTAYTITMRIYRGGGFAKDAVYLRGFRAVLAYLRDGGDPAMLFVGKIAARHIPVVRELQFRDVLTRPPLLPRFLREPASTERIAEIRSGWTIEEIARRVAGEARGRRGGTRKGNTKEEITKQKRARNT